LSCSAERKIGEKENKKKNASKRLRRGREKNSKVNEGPNVEHREKKIPPRDGREIRFGGRQGRKGWPQAPRTKPRPGKKGQGQKNPKRVLREGGLLRIGRSS